MPRLKRVFDLTVAVVSAALWIPVVFVCAALVLLTEGVPVFYRSWRRVLGTRAIRVVKFRTMVRNADRIANRETVPVRDTRFLNIPPDSPLYTPIGRLIERYHLTELPQFVHVLAGEMSIVGNRPLPENVVSALREAFPWAETRFTTPAGMTGPVQLVGRDRISDRDRLALESEYCRRCLSSYSMRLDVAILFFTVLVALGLREPFSVADVHAMMRRYTRADTPMPRELLEDDGKTLLELDAPRRVASR
jgi:lipopolysaccharide/colanic/teichoic acid biosynthesis glycosyltransferase